MRSSSSENRLHLSNIVAARLGRGVRELSALKGYASSIVVIWRPGGSYNQFIEPSNTEQNQVSRVRLSQERNDWPNLRVLQLLMSDDTAAIAESGESRQAEPDQDSGSPEWRIVHDSGRIDGD